MTAEERALLNAIDARIECQQTLWRGLRDHPHKTQTFRRIVAGKIMALWWVRNLIEEMRDDSHEEG